MRKFFATLLALVMVLSLMVPTAWAAEGDVTILYTNDVHTYINQEVKLEDESKVPGIQYSWIAALKDSLGENVLLVDAGDHAQGTAYGGMDKGKTIIDLMNAAGYDAATLGNHEFDYGQEGRINITDNWAEYPYLSCNFYKLNNGVRGENVLDAYKVFEKGGMKIAIIGITTPETYTKSTPAYFQDANGNYIYGIAGGEDGAALYADVQKAIDAASAEADVVIALGHLGLDDASKPWTSAEVIANTTGLAAFIDGHSHSTVATQIVKDKNGKDVVLTQTGEYLSAVGKMTIQADGRITTELLDYDDLNDLPPDAAVEAIEDAWIKSVSDQLDVKIGSTELVFDNYNGDERLVRKQETNTGDFAADALYYLFDNMDMDVDVAIMNGGGVRNKAVTGELTYNVAKTIHTFGNVACLQTITGQQLLDALEWGAKDVGTGENGGFLHVAGITYDIDTTVPSTVQQDNKIWTGAPTGEYRVCNVMVYDKKANEYVPLELNAKYNLAGYNYTLRDCGDGFDMFKGAVNVLDYVMEDYMVLANYIQGFENGVVKAANSPLLDKYPNMLLDYTTVNGSGRINGFDPMSATISKEWAKDKAADRPDSVTVQILRNGELYREVELTAANDWQIEVSLPLYDAHIVWGTGGGMSADYEYTFKEVEVEGYKSKIETEIVDGAIEEAQYVINDESQTEVISYVEECDLMALVKYDGFEPMAEAVDMSKVSIVIWAKDEAVYAEIEGSLDDLVAELEDAYDLDGVKVDAITGEQALKDLGGELKLDGTMADREWVFKATADAGKVNGTTLATGLNITATEVEVTITNTKQAPKTGDAGVAIYMVLAMMAVCGGAVLVSKKRAFN